MRQVLADALHRPRRLIGSAFGRTKRQVVDDLRSDPYLPYILAIAFLLCVFWVWHRLPNFATRDERWRVVDPVEVLAVYLDDPGFAAIQEGVDVWRVYGAMMYLSGLMLLPVFAGVLLTGRVDAFADMGRHFATEHSVGLWEHWQGTPADIWTTSVLFVRLANVAFAVGSVYVVYRLGTTIRDRATGRLASVVFTFTWALVVLAHEAGEDVPALFFFLLAVYFAVRYLEDGARSLFYAGCLCGGLSIAFKLSGGVSAVVLGAALLLRARRSREGFVRGLIRPRVILGGLGVAFVAIAVGYPSILFGSPSEFGARLDRAFSTKSDPHGWRTKPSWWWILRGYLHGAGLPLALGLVGGLVGVVPSLRDRTPAAGKLALLLVGVASFLLVFSRWSYVRTHHLLPTFPLLVVVLAVVLRRLADARPRVGRALIAVLVLTSAVYTSAGALAYASQPRDQATEWLSGHATEGETLETYAGDPQESVAPHGMDVSHVPGRDMIGLRQRCPEYVELSYHLPLPYLAPDDYSEWSDSHSSEMREEYVRDLLAEDTYPYEVAAEFGRRPAFVDGEPLPEWRRLLRTGIRPRSIQYGDPQDMGVDQYTVIMRRNDSC